MVISDGTFLSIIGHWLHHGYLSVSPVCLVTSPWCWCLLQIETPPATAGCPVLVVMVLPIWSRSLNLCLWWLGSGPWRWWWWSSRIVTSWTRSPWTTSLLLLCGLVMNDTWWPCVGRLVVVEAAAEVDNDLQHHAVLAGCCCSLCTLTAVACLELQPPLARVLQSGKLGLQQAILFSQSTTSMSGCHLHTSSSIFGHPLCDFLTAVHKETLLTGMKFIQRHQHQPRYCDFAD